jgi:hypothetical protein
MSSPTREDWEAEYNELSGVRLRNANPYESLEMLACRPGCSLSKVKRQLRRERREPSAETVTLMHPTVNEPLTAAAVVVGTPSAPSRPQAV